MKVKLSITRAMVQAGNNRPYAANATLPVTPVDELWMPALCLEVRSVRRAVGGRPRPVWLVGMANQVTLLALLLRP